MQESPPPHCRTKRGGDAGLSRCPRSDTRQTPREDIDSQLNKTALHIIQKALPQEHVTHIRGCTTAKEAWDSLNTLFQGYESIQSSKYDVALDKAKTFVMLENKTPEDLYRRLVTVRAQSLETQMGRVRICAFA